MPKCRIVLNERVLTPTGRSLGGEGDTDPRACLPTAWSAPKPDRQLEEIRVLCSRIRKTNTDVPGGIVPVKGELILFQMSVSHEKT